MKLGYGGTQAEMERLLEDAEKLSGQEFDISSFADIVDAIHIIQEEMDIAGTTAAEASDTISGSLDSMKSAWSNLVTGIADENANFPMLVENFVNSASIAAGNLAPRIEIALNGVGMLVDTLFPIIAEKIPTIITEYLPKFAESGAKIITSLSQSISTNKEGLFETIRTVVKTLIQTFVDNLPEIIAFGIELMITLATALIDNIPELIKAIPDIIKAVVQGFKNSKDDIIGIGKDIVRGLWDGVNGMFDWVKEKISGFAGRILDGLKEKLGIHSPSTEGAWIGGMLAEGFGLGFDDKFKKIKDNIQEEMDFGAIQGNVDVEGNLNGANNGSVYYLTQNFYNKTTAREQQKELKRTLIDLGEVAFV